MNNLNEWQTKFNQQAGATLRTANKLTAEAAKVLLSRIEKRTPIGKPELWNYPAPKDYKPGTLRASWVMDQELSSNRLIITISNDQPYAERVEYGWSTQAPKGMMRISIMEFSSIVNNLVSKYKV